MKMSYKNCVLNDLKRIKTIKAPHIHTRCLIQIYQLFILNLKFWPILFIRT